MAGLKEPEYFHDRCIQNHYIVCKKIREFDEEKMIVIGVDIGGTKCAVTLAKPGDRAIEFLDKRMWETLEGTDANIKMICDAIDEMVAIHNIQFEEIRSIGISCGGPLDRESGVILSPPNLTGWEDVPIVDILCSRYGKDTVLEHDANACALAEWWYGAARGLKNVVFLTFGTGMGAGLILDGKLYAGTCSMAGEVGHLRVAEDGPVGFGKAGSFEGYCSGGGIARLAELKGYEGVSAKDIAVAAKKGEAWAKEIYDVSAKYLGRGLSMIIDMLNPEMIVIGSVYARSEELFQEQMKKEIGKEAVGYSANVCRIAPAALGDALGDYAAVCAAINGRKK